MGFIKGVLVLGLLRGFWYGDLGMGFIKGILVWGLLRGSWYGVY